MIAPSSFDEDHLLRLARKKTVAGRRELAKVISDLFASKAKILTERERALVFDILRHLIRELELSIRQRLSSQLAALADVPRDLVVFLANDVIEIAYPILIQSPVLQNADLIEIIRHRTLEHQVAVALRYSVSEEVATELVQTGREPVVRALLTNPNAAIARATLEYLVEQSKRVDTFQEPLLRRKDLPVDLAKRMFLWVAAALRRYILDRFTLDPTTADDLLEQVAFAEIARAIDEAQAPAPAAQLLEHLAEEDAITPELLLSTLRDGEISLGQMLLGRMAGLRETLVMRILFEPGGEGLAIVCKALGFSKVDFSTLFALTRRARPALMQTFQRDLRKVLTLFDRMSAATAQNVLRKWQRDKDYLKAILELELQ